MLTVLLILATAALISTIVSATGHCPLYVPVMILSIIACLANMPLR